MPTTFLWKGRTPTGEMLSGELLAEDKQDLIAQLGKRRILITSVTPKTGGHKEVQLRRPRVTTRDQGVFTRQFATMINANSGTCSTATILPRTCSPSVHSWTCRSTSPAAARATSKSQGPS